MSPKQNDGEKREESLLPQFHILCWQKQSETFSKSTVRWRCEILRPDSSVNKIHLCVSDLKIPKIFFTSYILFKKVWLT